MDSIRKTIQSCIADCDDYQFYIEAMQTAMKARNEIKSRVSGKLLELRKREMSEMCKFDFDGGEPEFHEIPDDDDDDLVLDDEECPICLNIYTDSFCCKVCKQIICLECSSKMDKCPMCRNKYFPTLSNIPYIPEESNAIAGVTDDWVRALFELYPIQTRPIPPRPRPRPRRQLTFETLARQHRQHNQFYFGNE
jgi:hypothetical protein